LSGAGLVVHPAQIGASHFPVFRAGTFQSHSRVLGWPQAHRWRRCRGPQAMARVPSGRVMFRHSAMGPHGDLDRPGMDSDEGAVADPVARRRQAQQHALMVAHEAWLQARHPAPQHALDLRLLSLEERSEGQCELIV
jgi:hypothetical protein